MPITAAVIESNGWVLRLTLTGSLTSPNTNFGAYNFDVNGTPRLSLAAQHPGFVKSAGTAVAGTFSRTLVGLKPLRNPAVPIASGSLAAFTIDETDLGGGSIRVRIALSEHIYASETSLSLSTLAGWRTGEGAQSGLVVTNSSTLAAPLPIMRWVLPSYEVTTGTFRLSMLVASHHPVVFDPVAAIKFTITDGTTTKTVWATALSTDNSYGDNLRCHSVTVDPATATALTAGLLRCDAEVYPYLGAMRSTDPAGTRSVALLADAGYSANAETPFVIGYDPAGTRYSNVYAYIDPVNGSTTAAIGMIATTRAGAKALAAASRPKDILTAQQACKLLNRNLSNRLSVSYGTNGMVDGLVCILAVGTHANGFGSTTQSASTRPYEIPVTIEGDSDNSNPRANCILQTRTTAPSSNNVGRYRFRNMTIECGGAALTNASLYKWIDNVEIRAKAGLETSTTSPLGGGNPGIDNWNWCVTRSKIWRTDWTLRFGSASHAPLLIRASEFSHRVDGVVFVENRMIGYAEDGLAFPGSTGFGMHSNTAVYKAKEDIVIAYNDCRYLGDQFWYTSTAPAASAGTLRPSHRRHLIMNNVFEYIGSNQGTLFLYGESELVTMTDIIIEGNTFAGAGFNAFYNNPGVATLSDAATLYNETFNCILRNNATDRNASKQDDFNDPSMIILRAGASPFGYRPQLVQCWATHNGTGVEAHVDCGRSGSIGSFRRDGVGVRGVQFDVVTAPGWTNDQSYNANPANTGGGNYTPTTGSPFLNRITRANSDRDQANATRRIGGATGALESGALELAGQNARHVHRAGVAAITISLAAVPASARHVQRASTSVISPLLSVVPASARHVHRASSSVAGLVLALASNGARHQPRSTAALVGWSTALTGAATRLSTRASAALLAWAGTAGPASATLRLSGRVPALTIAGGAGLIAPGNTRLALTSRRVRLLPKVPAGIDQTLLVRSDARIFFITQTEQEL